MSLHPHVIAPVPEETARVARAAFPKGHPYLTFRDALGTIFQDEDFTALFPAWGQPGLPPWRLALVTIMQFRENLADRHAAEAVRARIDWKYLLSLELTDPGFDFSVLSEFRDRLLVGSAEELLLGRMLKPLEGVVLCPVDFDLLLAALLAGVLIEVKFSRGQGLKEGAHHLLVHWIGA